MSLPLTIKKMDPLNTCKENLRLLCATMSTNITPQRLEKFMLGFFDKEIIGAIKQRETKYLQRMTIAFRGELQRQLHDTTVHLTNARAQLTQQDKQMDIMRAQIDRRRLELEQQRRRFIHEILGMREEGLRTEKNRLTNEKLQNMLIQAFKDEKAEVATSAGRRSGFHEGMGASHLTQASTNAKQKAQKAQLMKLRDRVNSLQAQLECVNVVLFLFVFVCFCLFLVFNRAFTDRCVALLFFFLLSTEHKTNIQTKYVNNAINMKKW